MRNRLAWAGVLVCSLGASAQQAASVSSAPGSQGAAASAATYQGCVSKLPNIDRYVLATGDRCMLLSGNFNAEKVKDRLVIFRGLAIEPAGMEPLTLKVDKTTDVGGACSQTCHLIPPGSRGIHGKEKPGSEGGPPGVAPTPPPQR